MTKHPARKRTTKNDDISEFTQRHLCCYRGKEWKGTQKIRVKKSLLRPLAKGSLLRASKKFWKLKPLRNFAQDMAKTRQRLLYSSVRADIWNSRWCCLIGVKTTVSEARQFSASLRWVLILLTSPSPGCMVTMTPLAGSKHFAFISFHWMKTHRIRRW